jgi:hypothetical protein
MFLPVFIEIYPTILDFFLQNGTEKSRDQFTCPGKFLSKSWKGFVRMGLQELRI